MLRSIISRNMLPKLKVCQITSTKPSSISLRINPTRTVLARLLQRLSTDFASNVISQHRKRVISCFNCKWWNVLVFLSPSICQTILLSTKFSILGDEHPAELTLIQLRDSLLQTTCPPTIPHQNQFLRDIWNVHRSAWICHIMI